MPDVGRHFKSDWRVNRVLCGTKERNQGEKRVGKKTRNLVIYSHWEEGKRAPKGEEGGGGKGRKKPGGFLDEGGCDSGRAADSFGVYSWKRERGDA